MQAITDLAARHPSNKDHIIKLPFTARVYKTLVQGGHYNPVEKKIEGSIHFSIPPWPMIWRLVVEQGHWFASLLYTHIQPNLVAWATGEGSFVILSLFEKLCPNNTDPQFLGSQLKTHQKSIRQKGGDNKGTKLLLEKIAQFTGAPGSK